MRVLLVTTWDTACGIAEHSAYLKEAVERADPGIDVVPCPKGLDPNWINLVESFPLPEMPDLFHLNYHAALHSRWTAEFIQKIQRGGAKVVVTYHDTGVPNSQQCLDILRAADAGVVHEDCPDIIGDPELGPKVKYWRQGIPAGVWPMAFTVKDSDVHSTEDVYFKQWADQPIVASIGFPFPWKNYDLLAEASAAAGWALLLIAPNATQEQVAHWRSVNPYSAIWNFFVPRNRALSLLSGCDATAFLYANANTGTSAAIRLGIAARKPVLATVSGGCRQFRDLDDSDAHEAITWLPKLDVNHIVEALSHLHLGRVDPQVVRLAHLDSWERNGQRYAELYRSL